MAGTIRQAQYARTSHPAPARALRSVRRRAVPLSEGTYTRSQVSGTCEGFRLAIAARPRQAQHPELDDPQKRLQMKINPSDFRVPEGSEVDLKKWPTRIDSVYHDTDDYQEMLKEHVTKLAAQQEILYASDRYAILLILQAMDAAGKDGVIAHVMSGLNPQGCQVFSFKHPSATELQARFSLADHRRFTGTRQDRNLQPLLL